MIFFEFFNRAEFRYFCFFPKPLSSSFTLSYFFICLISTLCFYHIIRQAFQIFQAILPLWYKFRYDRILPQFIVISLVLQICFALLSLGHIQSNSWICTQELSLANTGDSLACRGYNAGQPHAKQTPSQLYYHSDPQFCNFLNLYRIASSFPKRHSQLQFLQRNISHP